MSTKLKTNLFSFATLRSSQLIDENEKVIGFISHPNFSESYFLAPLELENIENVDDARDKIEEIIDGFTDKLPSINAVKDINTEVWNFSNILIKNSNNLNDADEFELPDIGYSLQNGHSSETKAQIIKLWDNVFYSIATSGDTEETSKNLYVRQACLQMIVAFNYIEKVSNLSTFDFPEKIKYPRRVGEFSVEEKTKQYLRRVAKATVVIPPAFTVKKDVFENAEETKDLSRGRTVKVTNISASKLTNSAKQRIRHETELAKINLSIYNSIKEDLINLKEQYDEDYEIAYEAAHSTNVKQAVEAVENYIRDNPDKTVASSSEDERIEDTNIIDPINIYPVFQFNYPHIFSIEYLEGDDYYNGGLSTKATNYISENKYRKTNYRVVMNKLTQTISNFEEVASHPSIATKTTTIVKGVEIEANTSLYDFSLSFHYGQDVIDENMIFFLLTLDYPEAYFETAYYTIKIDGEQLIQSTDVNLLNKSVQNSCDSPLKKTFALNIFTTLYGETLSRKMIENEDIDINTDVKFNADSLIEFEGNFTLNNGIELIMHKKGGICETIITGESKIHVPYTFNELGIIHHGVKNIGVIDFRRVEQEVCCYIPGEVSHIENIMAKEYKEKYSTTRVKSVQSTELTNELEKEEMSETISTNRFDMNTEVARVVQQDNSKNYGFGINASYDGIIKISADAHGEFAYAKSTSESNLVAKNYAEDVTNRALERVTQRISMTRKSTITREHEESIRHGFDNREGGAHVTGIYRWVDKIYTNRLINYGKRLIFEFMIPEPAKFYKRAIVIDAEEKSTGNRGGEPKSKKPIKPDAPSIKSPSDVTRSKYSKIASKYNANVAPPLEEKKFISSSHSESIGSTNSPKSFTYSDLMVPQDYETSHISHSGSGYFHAGWGCPSKAYIKVNVAGTNSSAYRCGWETYTIKFNETPNPTSGLLTLTVNTKKFKDFSFTTEVECILKQSVFAQWQQETYDSIMSAYQQLLDEYTQAMDAYEAEIEAEETQEEFENQEKSITRNPRFNQEVILTELKRLSIEILTKPFGNKFTVGKDFYVNETKWETEGVPELQHFESLHKYGTNAKFFEQAFDWNLMAQMFLPYYWGPKNEWKKLFQSQDTKDTMFQKFLQSGLARIIVPVNPGFEKAVAYFMETGEVWNGTGMVINTTDDLYLSIVNELNVIEGFVEDEWESIVPTSLTIVQNKSAKLEETGLPCCEINTEDSLFTESTVVLAGKSDAPTN